MEQVKLPEALTQRFTTSTGKPRHKTEILNKKTGASIAVLTDPKKHGKTADEMVRRYNCHADLLEALTDIVDTAGYEHLAEIIGKQGVKQCRAAIAKATGGR